MNQLFQITIEDYLEVIKRAKEAGVQPGESMEQIFLEYMEEKGQKSFARTELSKKELISDLSNKHGNILEINTDDKGQQQMKIHKKEDLTP